MTTHMLYGLPKEVCSRTGRQNYPFRQETTTTTIIHQSDVLLHFQQGEGNVETIFMRLASSWCIAAKAESILAGRYRSDRLSRHDPQLSGIPILELVAVQGRW